METAAKVVNLAAFQAVWLASVLGAAAGAGWLGPLALAAFAAWHATRRAVHADEFALAAVAVLIGLVVDSGYLAAGLLTFAAPGPLPDIAPAWILSMWAGLALTLRHSLSWLSDRAALAALLGAVGGPAAYLAGSRLGAVELAPPAWEGALVVGVVWGAITPSLFALDRRWRQRAAIQEKTT